MRKRKRLLGVLLMIAALVIMTLPVSEADAASSASDFVIEGGTLVRYQGTEKTVSVPDAVKVIGESAFENKTAIEKVVLPASVTAIEPYAFWGCDSLETVVTGKGLTAIGDYAFAGCKGLKEMSLSSKVASIGIQAFADCVNLTDITIPEETKQIHESAFDGCAKLTIHCQKGSTADYYAQTFYERQKEMPEYEDVADYGETEEKPQEPQTTEPPLVTEPPYVVEGEVLGTTQVVGNSAFFLVAAEKLQPRQKMVQLQPEEQISAAEAIPKYTLVDDRIVADQAYYRSERFTELELPKGIEEIGQFAFARSTLESVVIPNGVREIAYGAFYHCERLAEVVLPETIENVEPKAFANTGWVENFLAEGSGEVFLISGGVLLAYAGSEVSVSIPDGVRVIAAEAFRGHAELEVLELPESLRVIGEAAFEDCTGLREIRLNQGLEQIKDRAFCGAAGASTKIPASVKSVGLRALEGVAAEYEGEQPGQSHEASAERLSNEAYRALMEETKAPGVRVVLRETEAFPGEAYASLEGAARYYELTVYREENPGQMEKAWSRVYGEPLPAEMLLCRMELTDNSGIPISKLGHQRLTLTLPLSAEYRGKELKVVGLDRNGQLVAVDAERVLVEGEECLCLSVTQLSTFGIYCAGEAGDEPLQTVSIALQADAPPSGAEAAAGTEIGFRVRRMLGCAMLLTGGAFCLPGRSRRRQ